MEKITLKTLATSLVSVKSSIEELAQMTANGFANTPTKADFDAIKSDVNIMKDDMSDMKLRMDYLAPVFEVRDLEKRVTKLEIKTGLRK